MIETCYIGFGSNLGDLSKNYLTAKEKITALPGVVSLNTSKLYRSEALTKQLEIQPWYLNGVFEIKTSLSLHVLLSELQKIETEMGRSPHKKWESRIIDLDILFYGNVIYSDSDIHVPHREIAQRRFVLLPLCDLIPDFEHPEFHITMKDMLSSADNTLKIELFSESIGS